MRLIELLEDNISTSEIAGLERRLNATVYQPEDQVKRNRSVIELDLPTNAHFMDRVRQRANKAGITTAEIEDLLTRAKRDPKLGYAAKIDAESKTNDPDLELRIQDPRTNLVVPVLFAQNDACSPNQKFVDGVPVCKNAAGQKVPKNKMVAKTIFRKGVDD